MEVLKRNSRTFWLSKSLTDTSKRISLLISCVAQWKVLLFSLPTFMQILELFKGWLIRIQFLNKRTVKQLRFKRHYYIFAIHINTNYSTKPWGFCMHSFFIRQTFFSLTNVTLWMAPLRNPELYYASSAPSDHGPPISAQIVA